MGCQGRKARRRAGILALIPFLVVAGCGDPTPQTEVGPESVLSFALSCVKEDGGFGPQTQPYAGATWTRHGVAVVTMLGIPYARSADCLRYLRAEAADTVTTLWDLYAIASARATLGDSGSVGEIARLQVRQNADGGWGARNDSVSSLPETYRSVATLALWKTKPRDAEKAARFVTARLHRDGRFDIMPRDSLGTVTSASQGHIWLTYCGVHALGALGYEVSWRPAVVAWLRACQQRDGGFSWRPGLDPVGGSDLWYTWLGVAALRTLGSGPRDSLGVVAYVNACQNVDGGFGDKPGWPSRLAATDYALRTLRSLIGDAPRGVRSKLLPAPSHEPPSRWRRMSVYHFYAGPSRWEREMGASGWSAGIPMYALNEAPSRVARLLQAPGVVIGDTSLADMFWTFTFPLARIRSPDGRVVHRTVGIWMPNDRKVGATEALIGAAYAMSDSSGAASSIVVVARSLRPHGAVVWVRLDELDQLSAYLAMDELLAGAEGNVAVVAALSDGTDLIRRTPWLERLIGRFPLAVAPVAPDSIGAAVPDDARVVWISRDPSPDDLATAFAEGRTACAVRDPRIVPGYMIYGTPPIASLVGGRADWKWWRKSVARR